MAEEKCSLCNMTVRNMTVHLKLNHKKKKKKNSGFTGFSPTSSKDPKSPSKEPCIERIAVIAPPQTASPFMSNRECPSSPALTEANFTLLTQLREHEKGMLRGWRKPFSRSPARSAQERQCPECKLSFPWSRSGHKFSNREFFDHVDVCGLDGRPQPPFKMPQVKLQDDFQEETVFQILTSAMNDDDDGKRTKVIHSDEKEEPILIEDDVKEEPSEDVDEKDELVTSVEEDLEENVDVNEGLIGMTEVLHSDEETEQTESKEENEATQMKEEKGAHEVNDSEKQNGGLINQFFKHNNVHVKLEEVAPEREAVNAPMVQIKLESDIDMCANLQEPKSETRTPEPAETAADAQLEADCLIDALEESTEPKEDQADQVCNQTFLKDFTERIDEQLGQEWFEKISAIEAKASGSSGCESSPQELRLKHRRKGFKKYKNRGITRGTKIDGPFTCPHLGCKKKFIRRIDMTKHKWFHTQEEKFRCLFCGAAFGRADRLRYHSRKCTKKKVLEDIGDIAESGEEDTDNEDMKKDESMDKSKESCEAEQSSDDEETSSNNVLSALPALAAELPLGSTGSLSSVSLTRIK